MKLRTLFSRKAPVAEKSSKVGPLLTVTGPGLPRWTPRRYDMLAEEGFRRNVVAYRCITLIAEAASTIPLVLYDDSGAELSNHPLLQLLARPNPRQSGAALLHALVAYRLIAGNAYLEMVRPSGTTPQELYALRPDLMKIIPGAQGLAEAYEYSAGGRSVRWPTDPLTGASHILHWRAFHAGDDWYGLAPLEAALTSIDQFNAACSWNQALLNNGARPAGALVYAPKEGPSQLSDEQFSRLKGELLEHYQGRGNAGRPLILEGGLQWQELSLNPKDMDWLDGRNVAARDIAMAFGVPTQLLGLPDSQTYANMEQARLAFYEETILPLLRQLVNELNRWLCPTFTAGLRLAIDEDEISALGPRRDAKWQKIQQCDFLTLNEKRAALGYQPLTDGDRISK